MEDSNLNPEDPKEFWRGDYNFYCGKTQEFEGKSYSPNSLNVRISSRTQAWNLVSQLTNFLKSTDSRSEMEPGSLDLLFFGSLEKVEETAD